MKEQGSLFDSALFASASETSREQNFHAKPSQGEKGSAAFPPLQISNVEGWRRRMRETPPSPPVGEGGRAKRGRMRGVGRSAVLASSVAPQLIATRLIPPAIAEPHILMPDAAAVRLVRLAQEAPRPPTLRALPFEVHQNLRSPVRPDAARASSKDRAKGGSCLRCSHISTRLQSGKPSPVP